jgi:hypothetical protein
MVPLMIEKRYLGGETGAIILVDQRGSVKAPYVNTSR